MLERMLLAILALLLSWVTFPQCAHGYYLPTYFFLATVDTALTCGDISLVSSTVACEGLPRVTILETSEPGAVVEPCVPDSTTCCYAVFLDLVNTSYRATLDGRSFDFCMRTFDGELANAEVVFRWDTPMFSDGFESGDTSGWSLALRE